MIGVEAFGPDGRAIVAEVTPGPVRQAIPRSRWSDDTAPATVEVEPRREWVGGSPRRHGKSEAFARMAEVLNGGRIIIPNDIELRSDSTAFAFRWPR